MMLKQGLNADFAFSLNLFELSDYLDLACFMQTGKRPIDLSNLSDVAAKHSAALKKLAEKLKNKKENQDNA